MSSFLRCSNLSLANFRKISPSTTCLYSAGSTEPLSLSHDCHNISSIAFSFSIFLAIYNFYPLNSVLKIHLLLLILFERWQKNSSFGFSFRHVGWEKPNVLFVRWLP